MTKTHIKITGTYYVANVKKKTENKNKNSYNII